MNVLRCTEQEFEGLRNYMNSLEGDTYGYFGAKNSIILKDVDGNYITNADKMLNRFWEGASDEEKALFNSELGDLFNKIVDFKDVELPNLDI